MTIIQTKAFRFTYKRFRGGWVCAIRDRTSGARVTIGPKRATRDEARKAAIAGGAQA